MKAKWIAGAMAFGLWSGVALADDYTEDSVSSDPMSEDVNGDAEADLGQGGSGMDAAKDDTTVIAPRQEYTQVTVDDAETGKEAKSDMRGLTLMLGGGVEGYTGSLAPQIDPGPAWGVTAAIKPSKVLGLELGYSGAVNELDNGRRGDGNGASTGADIVRNGGQIAASVGLTAAPVQPYLMGGIGYSRYNVRGGAGDEGFATDNVGHIPVGLGLRTHLGQLTADARFGYNVLFDQDFAFRTDDRELGGVNSVDAGRYTGTLNIGSTF